GDLLEHTHHTLHVLQLAQLIESKAPGTAQHPLPALVGVCIKAARLEARIGIEQALPESLIASDDMVLIVRRQRGEVIVTQHRCREELRVQGKGEALKTGDEAETTVDRAAARREGH